MGSVVGDEERAPPDREALEAALTEEVVIAVTMAQILMTLAVLRGLP
jgi:hypothetical protein